MPETLLRTKLFVPPVRPGLIPRQHLIERLNLGLQPGNKLILVSAPAGFGKTTLVSAWAQQSDRPAAWLSLEDGDNDLIRFLTYVIAALQSIDDNMGDGLLVALQSPEAIDVETVLTALLNEIARLPGDAALILDDYHAIEARPIHDALAFLLEHLPPQIHLVILTRADPPLPLPRMRARGTLLEIRERELRFSLDETTRFLRTMLDTELSGENVQTLQHRTEGWIAGLQLAVLAIQSREHTSDVVAAFGAGHQYIVEYLIEEVVNGLPEARCLFLMQTSLLSRLNGSLCDALTGRSDGHELLEWCEKSNLFIAPLGGAHGWYRYHRLFADVMANRLQRLDPDKLPELHRRAASWFRQQEFFDEAIKHALAAGDHLLAAEIVESQDREMLHLGRLATLKNWLEKLPAGIVYQRPRLAVDSAWVYLLVGELGRLEVFLTSAEGNLDALDNPDELRGQIAAIRAYAAARLGEMDRAIEQAYLALELLPDDDFSVRCVVAFVLGGVYHLQGDVPRAMPYLEQASELGQQAGNIHLAVAALGILGDIRRGQHDLAGAQKVYYQALQLGSGASGQPLPFTAGIYTNLAEVRLAQNDLSSAREFALTGLALGEKWLNVESQVVCYLALARIDHLEGNAEEARAALEEARSLAAVQPLPPIRQEQMAAVEELISAADGARADQGLRDPLSERELEILGLFAAGLSNQEIADQLIISLGTVKAHSSNIYRKLDVRNRAQAVVKAGELNLL